MRMMVFIFLILLTASLLVSCGNKIEVAKVETTSEQPETEKKITEGSAMEKEIKQNAKLLYMGHASIRITTAEGKVIYIDPYAGNGYGPAADLILITHGHFDHNNADMIKNRNDGCTVITWKEALEGGEHQTFDLGYAEVEAVEAGYNRNHDVNSCVGYVITLSDGVRVYVSGDTSTTRQMAQLAEKGINYAFFCCDGIYNMDLDEAAECARLVGAKHNIPYHVIGAGSGSYFDKAVAEQFDAPNRLIIDENEEIELTSD